MSKTKNIIIFLCLWILILILVILKIFDSTKDISTEKLNGPINTWDLILSWEIFSTWKDYIWVKNWDIPQVSIWDSNVISWLGWIHCSLENFRDNLSNYNIISKENVDKNNNQLDLECKKQIFNINLKSIDKNIVIADIYKDNILLIKDFPAYYFCWWDMCPWMFSYNESKWLLYYNNWWWDVCSYEDKYILYDISNQNYKLKLIQTGDIDNWNISIENQSWKIDLNLEFLEDNTKKSDALIYVIYKWLHISYLDLFKNVKKNIYKAPKEIYFSIGSECWIWWLNYLNPIEINTDTDIIKLKTTYNEIDDNNINQENQQNKDLLNIEFDINDLTKILDIKH